MFIEQAVKYIFGFNSFSEEEQMLYDKIYISKDSRTNAIYGPS